MHNSGQKVWSEVLGTFKNQISASTYKTWFSGSHFVESKIVGEKNLIIVGVKNNFLKEQIESRYLGEISQILNSKSGENTEVIFIVANGQARETDALTSPLFSGVAQEVFAGNHKLDGLNSANTFENFVVANSNNLAFLAATQAAANIGRVYNPLLIYGSVGVGKTHLMQAIGNDVLGRYSNIKVLYATSEKFTNDYIESLRNRTQSAFRQKYRGVDLIMVDDVQFLAGKESTQDEFFHTFNELNIAGKQIVLVSDRHPRELGKLNERLVSRFLGGMTVDIGTPDLEMRIAILKTKCKARNVNLSDEVINYIADSCRGSVREIEGVLISTLAQMKILGEKFNIDDLKKTLDSTKVALKQKPTTNKVFEATTRHFRVDLQQIKGTSRKANIVLARQVIMYFLRKELGVGLETIGTLLGGKDHSTVIHGVGKVEQQMISSGGFRDEVLRIREIILK